MFFKVPPAHPAPFFSAVPFDGKPSDSYSAAVQGPVGMATHQRSDVSPCGPLTAGPRCGTNLGVAEGGNAGMSGREAVPLGSVGADVGSGDKNN